MKASPLSNGKRDEIVLLPYEETEGGRKEIYTNRIGRGNFRNGTIFARVNIYGKRRGGTFGYREAIMQIIVVRFFLLKKNRVIRTGKDGAENVGDLIGVKRGKKSVGEQLCRVKHAHGNITKHNSKILNE